MVLGNRVMTSMTGNLTCLFLVYASAVAAEPTDHMYFSGHSLDLLSKNDKCVVIDRRTGRVLDTKLTAPCLFMRTTKDRLLSFRYPKVGTVFVISGAPADRDYISKWSSVSLQDQCSSEAQGLIVNEGKVTLTENKNESGLYCPRIGVDEKICYGFAHQR